MNKEFNLPTSPEAKENRDKRLYPAVVALGIVATGGLMVANEINNQPEFSEELHSTIVQQGDTIWDIASEHVDNHDGVEEGRIVHHIAHIPENLDILEDRENNYLQPGDEIYYPESVEK